MAPGFVAAVPLAPNRLGMFPVGAVAEPDRAMLEAVLSATHARIADQWDVGLARGELFWVTLWQAGQPNGSKEFPIDRALDLWVRKIVAACYPNDDVVLDGYGFTVNPVASRAQEWHVDYHRHYSTLFIPMTTLTPDNALQYVAMSDAIPDDVYAGAARNPSDIDFDMLLAGCAAVQVCQCIARPFTILKMDFGVIHRGVGNRGREPRIMFSISVRRADAPLGPAEPVVASMR